MIWEALTFLIYFVIFYVVATFILTLVFAKIPRLPKPDTPDWGRVEEHRIPADGGKFMEAWVVYPDTDPKPYAVVLTHGWARNRGRMVDRARYYGKAGYITIIFSARDHGNSDKELIGMSIYKFSRDIEAVLRWWNKPVILNGHSIGAGASLLVAARQDLVKGVIAEAPPYAIPGSLYDIYKPILRFTTPFFLPGIMLCIRLIFIKLDQKMYSPLHAAPDIQVPVLIIHGKNDDLIPYYGSVKLSKIIKDCQVWIVEGADHHGIEFNPGYEEKVINFVEKIR